MRTALLLPTSCLIAMVYGAVARSEVRTWTDRTGQQIEAELRMSREDTVYLLHQGERLIIRLAQLSEADQRYVRDIRAGKNSPVSAFDAAASAEGTTDATAQTPEASPGSPQKPPAQDSGEAPAPTGIAHGELRTWTARNGKYTVEAEFVTGDELSVTLGRDGKQRKVPLAALCDADQQFVRDSLAAASPTLPQGPAPAKSADEANEPTGNWENLIDPSSFDKWTTVGAPDVFKLLPDATIRGAGGRAYLVSPKTYSDFELTGRMKVSGRGNGGVFFDVPRGMNADSPRGYEVQLYVRRPGDTNGTGSIWDNGRITVPLAGRFEMPDRWYSLYIRCQGAFIVVKIDNQTIFEREDTTRGGGHVALQCYEATGEVHYADMKICELRPAEKTVVASPTNDGTQVAASEPFAVFDIKLGMTDREVAQVLLRKGIRPADVRIQETYGGEKYLKKISNTTKIQPDPTRPKFIWTELEIDFAEDLPARPGTWVCIRVKYWKDFVDYGGSDLSPVWSKVRADLIERFGPPSKEGSNEEIVFGDENTRYLKASHPCVIELEDKELAKRLRDAFDRMRREQAQQKALTQGENVAETIELNY